MKRAARFERCNYHRQQKKTRFLLSSDYQMNILNYIIFKLNDELESFIVGFVSFMVRLSIILVSIGLLHLVIIEKSLCDIG